MKIYIMWLTGVILWNFRFTNVITISNVIIAIIIIFKFWTKEVSKILINLLKNKYSENRKLISF